MCMTHDLRCAANSFGVFQAYYQTGPLKEYSSSSIAWIGSIQVFLTFAAVRNDRDTVLYPLTRRAYSSAGCLTRGACMRASSPAPSCMSLGS
jgi:hypothetical protein